MARITRSAIIAGAVIACALVTSVFSACNKTVAPASHTSIVKCISCGNNGTCINDTCRCNAGYEGTGCETLSREKFVGRWTAFEKGSITVATEYFVEVEHDSGTSASAVICYNLFNYFTTPPYVTGYVHMDTLFIPAQTSMNKTIVGFGIFTAATTSSNATITMHYKVTDNTSGVVDDFGYDNPSDNPSQWNK